jgi:hypothetical protein
MSKPYLSTSHARELVAQITHNDHSVAPALFELLSGLSDPDGNPLYQSLQDQVMRDAFVMMPQFETAYETARELLVA